MTYAVITSGSKQYFVTEGQKVRVEKLPIEAGKAVTFEEVLLTAKDDQVKIGTPLVAGAKVSGKVTRHGRLKKVTGVKMKAKKRLKKYFGHKQHFTEVEISKIG